MEAQNDNEGIITQFAFSLKVAELKTATIKTDEKQITVHVYSNDSTKIAELTKQIYDDAVKKFRTNPQ